MGILLNKPTSLTSQWPELSLRKPHPRQSRRSLRDLAPYASLLVVPRDVSVVPRHASVDPPPSVARDLALSVSLPAAPRSVSAEPKPASVDLKLSAAPDLVTNASLPAVPRSVYATPRPAKPKPPAALPRSESAPSPSS